jgi:hypothetical protein
MPAKVRPTPAQSISTCDQRYNILLQYPALAPAVHLTKCTGCSWTAAVSSNSRLSLRENAAFLKSAGLLLPPQGNSQAAQFSNEDASLLFRASHHASTSISANQKALDAPDLGYCEFLEFLCRLALAPNFKVLGDTTVVMRMQELCKARTRSRAFAPSSARLLQYFCFPFPFPFPLLLFFLCSDTSCSLARS